MNPNDLQNLLAQQQALLNQAAQNAHQWQIVGLAVTLLMFIVGAWVVYMFYARLRDIADELMKMRITYEMAEARKVHASKPTPPRADDDSRYAPKP